MFTDSLAITFAALVVVVVMLPLKRKVKNWNEVVNTLIATNATFPSQKELREYLRQISPKEPSAYLQPTALVELRFRFGLKPQIGWAHLILSDTICICWAGEQPIFKNNLVKCVYTILLPVKRLRLKEEVLFLESKDEIVSSISLVSV